MTQTFQICPYCDVGMSALLKECIGCGCPREEMPEVTYESKQGEYDE